jgi:hypothetical protein
VNDREGSSIALSVGLIIDLAQDTQAKSPVHGERVSSAWEAWSGTGGQLCQMQSLDCQNHKRI